MSLISINLNNLIKMILKIDFLFWRKLYTTQLLLFINNFNMGQLLYYLLF